METIISSKFLGLTIPGKFKTITLNVAFLHLHLHLLEYCEGPSNSINSQELTKVLL